MPINKGEAMNVSLTPDLERFVQEKVKGGMYTSASEVIRESLRLMFLYDGVLQQRISQLTQAIDIGLDDIAAGRFTEGKKSHQKMKQKIDDIAKGKDGEK